MLVPAFSKDLSERIAAYKGSPRLNQSLLKDIHDDPLNMNPEYRNKKRKAVPSTAMNVGSIVDVMFATQDTPEEFADFVYVDMIIPPKEGTQMRAFCDFLIEKGIGQYRQVSEIPYTLFEAAYQKGGFGRDSYDKVVNTRFPEEGYAYVESRLRATDKLTITEYEHNRAADVFTSLTEHPFTKDLFIPEEGETIEYQFPVFADLEINGQLVPCKALLDMIRFNHNTKVIRWFDTKCVSGHIGQFMYSYEKLMYYIQGAFYHDCLIARYGHEWEVEMPAFIVESYYSHGNPILYYINEEELHVARYGGRSKETLRKITGYHEMIEKYLFYISSKQTAYTQEQLDNNGISFINRFESIK